jgi:NAD+--asparagine ADP-ribosyltransferase
MRGIGHDAEIVEGDSDDDDVAVMKRQMAERASASESSSTSERASSSSSALLAEGTNTSGTSNGTNGHRQLEDGPDPGVRDISPQAAGFSDGSTPPTSASTRNTFAPMNESSTTSERSSSSSTALLAEGTSASGTSNGTNGHRQDGLGPGARDISSTGFSDRSTPPADA